MASSQVGENDAICVCSDAIACSVKMACAFTVGVFVGLLAAGVSEGRGRAVGVPVGFPVDVFVEDGIVDAGRLVGFGVWVNGRVVA